MAIIMNFLVSGCAGRGKLGNLWLVFMAVAPVQRTSIPYLNLLASGGYLPALFHRLANKKMQKNSDTKGSKLLKVAKTLAIVGFSMYALAALAGLIVLVVAEAVLGILFVLLIAAIWGFFQLLGK